MIASNIDVYPAISKYRAEKDGFPFLKVQSWESDTGSIAFDFGFPIRHSSWKSDVSDSLLLRKHIKYGKLSSFKAVKATFYGKYAKN